jgi:hypothetical protein
MPLGMLDRLIPDPSTPAPWGKTAHGRWERRTGVGRLSGKREALRIERRVHPIIRAIAGQSAKGQDDQAFKWLDRAYAEKDSYLYRIKYALEFAKLHDDPRYKTFLQKMKLPE